MGVNRKEPRVGIVVLGCDKNTADAECFAGALADDTEGAEILAVRTRRRLAASVP